MPEAASRPASAPGLFLTFEGGEGTGKSTQAARLADRFRAMGREAVVTREPGGSERAEAIRGVLLSGAAAPHGPFAEAALFAAARGDHVDRTIRPALGRGAVVVCDRFTDSTRVYQGVVAGLPDAVLARLDDAATTGIAPGLTLVLDLPAETGLARAGRRRGAGAADRFEAEGAAYHAAIREAFLAIARREPDRCAIIDALAPPDDVEALIWAEIVRRLPDSARHVG